MEFSANIWSALAVGLACIWVAIGQGYLTMKAMRTIGRNPKMHTFYLTIAILGIALVESAAIYGLIMWFQILTSDSISTLTAIWIWLAVWLSWLWVWIWEWKMIEWAFDAMNKDPENNNKLMTYMILFLALIESAAIYGLVIWYQLLSSPDISPVVWLAAGLSIWLAGLWVAIWEWLLAKKCLQVISQDRINGGFYITLWVLWIALVESAAIYSLIVSFNIISQNLDNFWIIWASLAIWLSAIWVGIWEGRMIAWALEAIKLNPKNKAKILTYMILFVALIESAAIYGLITAFHILADESILHTWMIWAWLAIWLAWLWVGIWESIVAKASVVNIAKDEKNTNFYLTLTVLWIALVESAAIYGLITSFNIISQAWDISISLIWAWLAIWLAWLWVGIWEGKMVSGAINWVYGNPNIKTQLLTYMILFLALIESAAIYGLIIAFQIIWSDNLTFFTAIWIGLSIWLAWLWVGIWEGLLWKKSLESISLNNSMQKFYLVSTILFIALVESAAIYALVVSFQLFQSDISLAALWVWCAVWLAWLWVGIWEGILTSRSLELMWENPESKNFLLTITILGVALVESVAIYGLIIWFQIIWDTNISEYWAIAMWLAIWLSSLWVAYWEWKLVQWSLGAIAHHPEKKNKIIPYMVLFLALIESAAIYGLVVAFQIFNSELSSIWLIWAWLAVWLAW